MLGLPSLGLWRLRQLDNGIGIKGGPGRDNNHAKVGFSASNAASFAKDGEEHVFRSIASATKTRLISRASVNIGTRNAKVPVFAARAAYLSMPLAPVKFADRLGAQVYCLHSGGFAPRLVSAMIRARLRAEQRRRQWRLAAPAGSLPRRQVGASCA